MSNTNLKYDIHGNLASVTLPESVTGGDYALEFTGLLEEINSLGCNKVIVRIENVKVMNSSGLGMLVAGLTRLKNVGGNLVLSGENSKIINLMKITHLDKVIKVFDKFEDALKSV